MPFDLLDLHHGSPEPHTDRAARAPVSRDVYARYEGPIPDIARDSVPVELGGVPKTFPAKLCSSAIVGYLCR